jgi:hypothetical protein
VYGDLAQLCLIILLSHNSNDTLLLSLICYRRYYKKQDDLIAAFEGVVLAGPDTESADIAETSRTRRLAYIMAKVSFFVNLVST